MAIPHASPAKPPILVIVGPTASGKSKVAALLAKKLKACVISCDSMQVYKRMPILTQAEPGAKLSSFLEPTRDYNASRFARDAGRLIAAAIRRSRVPLVVGGTGLYLRALLDGLFDTGARASDLRYRKALLAEAEGRPAGYLHEKLKRVDAPRAAQIHPNDHRRIVRALEVYHLTKRPMSEQLPNRAGLRSRYAVRSFLLEPERAQLYARIDRRVDRMLAQGLLKEVKKLGRYKLSRTASMALGVREMKAVLDKKMTLEAAAALLKKNTRHYAKRQLSWFRHDRDITVVPVAADERPAVTAARILELYKAS